jgi:hypothetical protein
MSENTDTKFILADTSLPDNMNEICDSIIQGTAKVVSDGSFLSSHGIGSAAWIIESPNQTHQCKGKINCPGPSNIQSSHRSELISILGVITHVTHICSAHNIQEGSMEIGCDGLGALSAIQSNNHIIKSSWKHFDMIKAIRKSIQLSKLNWRLQHVKGHQDDETLFDHLDRWSQLNVLVDKMAKDKLQVDLPHIATLHQRPFHLPHEHCSIYWNDRRLCGLKMCSEMKRTLTSLIHTNSIQEY